MNLSVKNFISCVLAIEQRASFFIIISIKNRVYIIFCRNFIKDCFQTIGVKKLAKILRIDCVYWFDGNDSVCCSRDIRIDDYCPPYQKNVLVVFSKDLHDFNTDFCL